MVVDSLYLECPLGWELEDTEFVLNERNVGLEGEVVKRVLGHQ